jgi:hypothetical protein
MKLYEVHAEFWWEKRFESDQLENRGLDLRISLGLNVRRHVARRKADGTGSGSCPVADFGICIVELSV